MVYWRLPRLGREFYQVEISTEPPIADWEISFDHGQSWHDLTYDTDSAKYRILVRGPNFAPPDGDTQVSVQVPMSVMPYLRAVSDPEVIIRDAPKIDLV